MKPEDRPMIGHFVLLKKETTLLTMLNSSRTNNLFYSILNEIDCSEIIFQ